MAKYTITFSLFYFHVTMITPYLRNRESVLERDVAVGENSKIGERTFVTQSVIGSRCTIGNDVYINNAYIWDDVNIKVRPSENFIIDT